MAITCPNCNADLPDDAVFCDQCGASLSTAPSPAPAVAAPAPPGDNTCPQCGASTIPGEAFCDNCGASLAEPQVSAASVSVEPEPQSEPALAPVEGQPDLTQCPACGAENLPDSSFCSNCGIVMEAVTEAEASAPEPEPEPIDEVETAVAEAPVPIEETPVAAVAASDAPAPTGRARFVVRDSGAEIALPTAEGEYVIGREDPVSGVFPAIDMNAHDGENLGVSRRHAQVTVEAGIYFLQDLDSTNFTFLDRKKLAPFTPAALSNGDEVRLGKLVLTFLE